MKKQYGWVTCIMCSLLMFCTVGLTGAGFSAYQPYLLSERGLTNTQVAAVIMCRNLFGLFGMLSVTFLIRKFEVRAITAAGLVFCGVGFAAYGAARSMPVFFLGSILTGIALGIGGTITASVIIGRWFREHRGMAIGICMASTGLSTILASPLITLLVIHSSLERAFQAETIFILILAVIVAVFLRNRPDGKNTFPGGAKATESVKVYALHTAPTGLAGLLMIGIFLFGMPGISLYSNLSVLYSSTGFEPMEISMQLSLFGISLMVGKCIYGQVADRFGTWRCSWAFYGMTALGTIFCCMARNGNYMMSLAAAFFIGLGLSVTTVSIPLYATRVALESEYAGVVSKYQMLSTLGALTFGMVPGVIADKCGDYVPAYAIMLVIVLVSMVVMQCSYHTIRMIDVSAE